MKDNMRCKNCGERVPLGRQLKKGVNHNFCCGNCREKKLAEIDRGINYFTSELKRLMLEKKKIIVYNKKGVRNKRRNLGVRRNLSEGRTK